MSRIDASHGFEHLQKAFRSAAKSSGVSFDFLVKTAARESGMRSTARAKTSSAAGLFQFVEQTWLGVVSRHGAKHGLEEEAAAITQTPNGRFHIGNAASRARILGLRHDPAISTNMAAELTADNQQLLETKLGRKATDTELYIAHFMGVGKAGQFLGAVVSSPQRSASELFPLEANSNAGIFLKKDGKARSIMEVFTELGRLHGEEIETKSRTLKTDDHNPELTSSPRWAGMTGGIGRSSLLRLSPVMVQLLAELSAPKAPDERSSAD